MTTSDRPTIDERYGRATRSSHLEVLPEQRCDVDYIVAAGWTADTLGVALFRLRSEWDGARGEHRLALESLRSLSAEARYLERAVLAGAADQERRLDDVRRRIDEESVTAMALTLMQLTTLHEAKLKLLSYALKQATLRRYMRPDEVVVSVVGSALQAWLDPLCWHCQGVGFSFESGMGSPRVICTRCHGSGKRPMRLGVTYGDHQFGRFLLTQMDRKADRVAQKMRRFLASR